MLAPIVQSQVTTGTISGIVFDPGGGAVPAARVTVTNIGTGAARSLATNSEGSYSAQLLPPGTYSISAEKTGFRKTVVSGIVLEVAQAVRVDVSLQIGQTSQSVQVTGAAPLLQTSGTEVGQVLDTRAVGDLPLNGRQFLQLAELTPSVVEPPAGTPAAQIAGTQGPQLAINGNRQDANNYTIDGTTALDVFYNTLSVSPSIDAIEEFKVQSSLSSIEWGGQGGGYVNILTKSGTNNFHGTAYEFLRNDKLDAYNFFDDPTKPVPPYKQNQFGGTFGGPIKKDKTFFFAGYEGNRIRQTLTGLESVPTADMRNGNFSAYANNASLSSMIPIDPQTGLPFPDNKIPPNRIDAAAQALLALVPMPTDTNPNDVSGNLRGEPELTDTSDQFDVRIDQRLGASDNLSVRYLFLRSNELQPFLTAQQSATNANLPGFGDFVKNNDQNIGVTYAKVFSQNTVLQVRFGFDRVTGGQSPQNKTNFSNIIGGLSTVPANAGVPSVSIAGFTSFGTSGASAIGRSDSTFEWSANVSRTMGKHSLQIGGFVRRLYFDPTQIYGMGTFAFNGFLTTNAFADFLLGIPFTADNTYGNLSEFHYRAKQFAGYLADTWRVTSGLTLDYGLRYDYRSQWDETNGRLATLSLNPLEMILPGQTGNFEAQSFVLPNILSAITANLPVVGSKNAGYPSNLIEPNRKDFGPRVGFSWSPSFDKKTVVRGGYGIFYSYRPGWLTYVNDILTAPIAAIQLTLNFIPGVQLPVESVLTQTNFNVYFVLPSTKQERDGYVQNWNFGIERSFGNNTLFELRYNGSKGTGLYTAGFFNLPKTLGDPSSSLLPFFAPGSAYVYSGASSSYNAMVLRGEKRYSHGFIVAGSWTWSRSIDDDSLLASTISTNIDQSPNKSLERGLSDFSVTHRVVGDVVYEFPIGPGRAFLHPASGFASKLLEGWQLSAIVAAQTGLPFSVNEDGNECGTGVSNCRPNIVGANNGNLPSSQRNVKQWFNTSAFVIQPPNTYGNAGRNILYGPGLGSVDLSLGKNTRFLEHQAIRFQLDCFNTFNKTNFSFPQRFIDAPSFGQIFSAGPPRLIQASLRYSF